MKKIIIKGAREHNLKNLDLELPRDRLIVITGKSGSGKSSLAFDTVFAEGQRRYVESLSAYARQFLGQMDKPDLDYIEGLSPAISIEQKTTHRNPRSTVGTITEIYDYLRLLFARVGRAVCPNCAIPVDEQSIDQIIESVLCLPEESKIMVLAPLVKERKGEFQNILNHARRSGFARMRVDGTILSLDEEIPLAKTYKHTLETVIDRFILRHEDRSRLADAVETALDVSGGKVLIVETEGEKKEHFFSDKSACPRCGFSIPEIQTRLFSFNNPYGACSSCSGLGIKQNFDPEKILPDETLSCLERGIAPYNPKGKWYKRKMKLLARKLGFELSVPLSRLTKEQKRGLLYGGEGEVRPEESVIGHLEDWYKTTSSRHIRSWLEDYMTKSSCPDCGGTRLRPESLAVRVSGKNIHECTVLTIREGAEFFENLELSDQERFIAEQILKEIRDRMRFLVSVGLDYLSLDREAGTLSGGESQRIRLATQIGSSLTGVLYVLDEPTIGLHQRDNDRLLKTLKHLRDLGNTLIVVEHDEQTIREADHIVDMGPEAGIHGGRVVAEGTLKSILKNPQSPTGRFLSGRESMTDRRERRKGTGAFLAVEGAAHNNLKKISVKIPLGVMTAITGVSGSGKSSFLTGTVYPALAAHFLKSRVKPGVHRSLKGLEHLDKVISIDQSPIGRTPRSNPATYVGLFTPIRELFSKLPESRARGYLPGRFSFNVKGGRCESCEGAGTKKIEMHFLPDVYVVCDVCRGKRFNKETLEVRYKGKNIYDILEMTIEEALPFFSVIPVIKNKLETLSSVGLEYIKLGQSALTLSGGEAQRVKLALELSKKSTGKTFYVIDEPTTGLHFADVKLLLRVLHSLVDKGNTICLIEHNLDVIKQADHLIDLGPEGGKEGGRIVAQGPPEKVARCGESYTGSFLRQMLDETIL